MQFIRWSMVYLQPSMVRGELFRYTSQIVRRTLSNIKDCSTAGSESTMANEQNSNSACRLTVSTSGTPATIESALLASSSTTTSSDPLVIITPIKFLSQRSGILMSNNAHDNTSMQGLPRSCALPADGLLKTSVVASGDVTSVCKKKTSLHAVTNLESAKAKATDGRADDSRTAGELPNVDPTAVESQAIGTRSAVARDRDRTSFGVSGTTRLRRRESWTSGNSGNSSDSGGRVTMMQPSSMTIWTAASPHHKSTRRKLTGDTFVARRPSSLSASAVAVAERRTVELRQHIERSRRSRLRDELKVSLALLIVIVLFVVSWAPISLVNVFDTFDFGKHVVVSVDHAAVGMMFLQPALNPVVYGLMNRNFRDSFKKYIAFRGCNRVMKLRRTVVV